MRERPNTPVRQPSAGQKDALLGRYLVEKGLLSERQFADLVKLQAGGKRSITDMLLEQGLLNEKELAQTLAASLDLPFVDLDTVEIDEDVTGAIPPAIIRRQKIFPFALENNVLQMACEEPPSTQVLGNLRRVSGKQIALHIADADSLKDVIDSALESENSMSLSHTMTHTLSMSMAGSLLNPAGDSPELETSVAALLDDILMRALRQRASDVHLETAKDQLRLRFRIDGALRDIESYPLDVSAPIISRIKVISNLNIAEKKAPQDGGFTFEKPDMPVDIRVSILPNIYGEKAVLRLLTTGKTRIDFVSLGMEEHTRAAFSTLLKKPHGLILVSGPTGSGKSTALYASLLSILSPEINITTVEDPVEYKMDGITQVQVNPARNVTFANALRSILRQDPDVIMIGEIRDRDTADIAIQSALTGHLVLATIHTNDAPSALTRLIEVGCEPYLVSSAVIGVMAQRLVRLVCESCKQPFTPSAAEWKRFGINDPEIMTDTQWARGDGCRRCERTGYRGRTGIYELMLMDKTIRQEVIKRTSSDVIREIAVAGGMQTLMTDGLIKVNRQQTTPEEVLRVTVLE